MDMLRWSSRCLVLVVVLTGLGACDGSLDAAPPMPETTGPVVAEPAEGGRATPGGVLELTFEPTTGRGSHMSLLHWDGEAWLFAYHLQAASDDPAHASWEPPEGSVTSRLLHHDGPGPDFVRIPEPAPAGWYRVCIEFPPDGAPCTPPFEVTTD